MASPRVTLKTVAEACGVSVSVASTVLNATRSTARVSPAQAERIRATAAELGYRPNHAARAMQSQRSRQVGVVVRLVYEEGQSHPLQWEFIQGIDHGLAVAGYTTCLLRMAELWNPEAIPAALRTRMLDGVIVCSNVPPHIYRNLPPLVDHLTWLDADVFEARDCIRRDERAAGALAAERLLATGIHRLRCVVTSTSPERERHFAARERLDGIAEACTRAGVPLELLAWREAGQRLDRSSFEPGDGLLALNAYLARALAYAASRSDLAFGPDLPLACCDDAEDFHRHWPGLGRVRFDRLDLGRRAAELFVARLAGDEAGRRSQLVTGGWIPGSTCPEAG